MQYTAIFHGCKNDNFQLICFTIFIFLIKTYTCIVGTIEAVLTGTHNICFRAKNKKIMYTPVVLSFTILGKTSNGPPAINFPNSRTAGRIFIIYTSF